MSTDTQSEADAILAADGDDALAAPGSTDAEATEAYLRSAIGGTPAEKPAEQSEQADDKEAAKPKLYMGKYETVEDMEKATRHFQSEAERNKADAERARRYKAFLEEAETDPKFREHVLSYYREEAGDGGEDAAEPVTKGEVKTLLRERENAAAAKAASEREAAQAQQDAEAQIAQLQQQAKLSDEQVSEFLDSVQGKKLTLLDLFRLTHLDEAIAAARKEGQAIALGHVRAAGSHAPPVGLATGAATKRTLAEQMADEIVGASRADNKEAQVAAELGLK